MQDEQQNEVEVAEEVETPPAEVSTSVKKAEVVEEIEDRRPKFIQGMEAFVDTKLFQGLMLITTIYALIGTDIAAWIGLSQAQYHVLHWVSFIALILFFVEWILQWICKDGYYDGGKGFFFWLDFIAALSLIPDVPWISEPLAAAMGLGGGAGGGLAIARAGRAARAGARAGRTMQALPYVCCRGTNRRAGPSQNLDPDGGMHGECDRLYAVIPGRRRVGRVPRAGGRSKGQCIRTLSVVVVQPASSDAGGVHDPTSEFFILYFRVYLHDK